jgi:protein tyrosine/serine phosphatase
VSTLLTLIETLPAPVFIHCLHGCDRTGTIVACYRIKHHSWSSRTALEEARKYGLSKFERGMRNYILDFGKALPGQ